MFKNKLFSIMLVLVLLAGALVGCSNEKPAAEKDGEGDKTVKIGINYELSGGVASYGQSSVDGIKMAFDEINAAGGIDGKMIEPIEYDNKSEPAEATSTATKLMTNDKVVAVLGPATSGNFKAQEPVAMKNKIPMVSASATADDVTVKLDKNGKIVPGSAKEYVFRLCFSDSFQGTAMANFAARNLEAKTAVIIKDNSSDYAKGLAENFRATFTDGGGTIVAEEGYIAKEKDFNAILTSVKNQEYDVIFLPGYYEEAGLLIKQARNLGITAPILGADGLDSPKLLELAGAEALNSVYFSNHYSSLDQDPVVVDFIKNFKDKYKKDPDAFNALGYDLGKFIADAVKRAGSNDPEAIKDALAATKDFTGVTGSFSMDENHNPVKAIVVIELKDGVQASSVKVGP
ncbi:amino acid/amide ABC transporter substrate-binding protein, HAAT family [Desulfonispora thiosulfatigenes DSM 11270]|uniref:Amino acid/amide ABC transporter substrate-binding protein, HAAT family n=1 Tax=Desulfonispora thiosulfatigenes DSM 11270 TaxID=656914 RepID=A0A1W1UE27_DESTI|nr:ABC transporter substrate-binding protein [Desulfonispora thiosulfatigenes]SMB79310.1 amino acid/amide ABC transporter substrate-binding protein, HAAT family [Desulfonispora thiosulfatigenes DSM 11270]